MKGGGESCPSRNGSSYATCSGESPEITWTRYRRAISRPIPARSISRGSVGSTPDANAALRWPSRSIRYSWKFQGGASSGRSSAALALHRELFRDGEGDVVFTMRRGIDFLAASGSWPPKSFSTAPPTPATLCRASVHNHPDRMAGMGREQDLSAGARGVRSKASNGRQPQQMSARSCPVL